MSILELDVSSSIITSEIGLSTLGQVFERLIVRVARFV